MCLILFFWSYGSAFGLSLPVALLMMLELSLGTASDVMQKAGGVWACHDTRILKWQTEGNYTTFQLYVTFSKFLFEVFFCLFFCFFFFLKRTHFQNLKLDIWVKILSAFQANTPTISDESIAAARHHKQQRQLLYYPSIAQIKSDRDK